MFQLFEAGQLHLGCIIAAIAQELFILGQFLVGFGGRGLLIGPPSIGDCGAFAAKGAVSEIPAVDGAGKEKDSGSGEGGKEKAPEKKPEKSESASD